MRRIEVSEIKEIAFMLAKKWLAFDEPIPDFTKRYPNVLESCLDAPFQTFDGKDLYPTAIKKISMLFYLIIKNHPFQNGNKRIAVMVLLYALSLEGKWIEVAPGRLYEFAVIAAESSPKNKQTILFFIESFIEKHLTPFVPGEK